MPAGALPDVLVIGAMKCGTTALHRCLHAHPDIAMSQPKELNFFVGSDRGGGAWTAGNWHRGLEWYRTQFDPRARLRGESSPGYTSPAHPEVAARMASVLPHARLVYLVRDPIARAVSQYRHHRDEGDERRPLDVALLDGGSQYVSRGRYAERLAPFLAHYPLAQVLVVAQEDLRERPRSTLRQVYRFAGADPAFFPEQLARPGPVAQPVVPGGVHGRLAELLADDAARLRELTGRDFPHWSV